MTWLSAPAWLRHRPPGGESDCRAGRARSNVASALESVRGLTSVVISSTITPVALTPGAGFSSPPSAVQKFQTQPVEELRMLDHDPVATFADDMKLGIRQALHHEQRTLQRRDPVVTSP